VIDKKGDVNNDDSDSRSDELNNCDGHKSKEDWNGEKENCKRKEVEVKYKRNEESE
jgi:hypothetical protein